VKRVLAVALVLSFSAASPAVAARQPAANPVERLVRLYEDRRYFELRDALALIKDDPSIDVQFFRGAVDQVFNRLDSAVSRLRSYLLATEKRPARMMTKEAWALLADAFRRLGRYREATEAFREILDRFGHFLVKDERAECESQIALWSALADVPPQSVEIEADTTIRMKNRHFAVSVGNRTFYAGYDTGSSMSVLYQSIADELAVMVYGPPVRIQTGTGTWVEGRTAVVPEMRLGSVIIRNAVFFVLPDKLFPSASLRFGVDRRGLLGMPVLAAFKEFTETKTGELIIPAKPRPRPQENMCFSGFMPVVEILRRGARLSFCLDTGSAKTFLCPPFLQRYYGEITSESSLRESLIGGVGVSRRIRVRILNELMLQAGGKDIFLLNVFVHTEVTHADTRDFYGTLGIDLLAQCARMTCNFESMSFILE